MASGFEFRNTFHLSPYAVADLFNPCGGRPASITPRNVEKLFDRRTGEKKFKFIVEGANVFITDDARRMLEERGVILFKDGACQAVAKVSRIYLLQRIPSALCAVISPQHPPTRAV